MFFPVKRHLGKVKQGSVQTGGINHTTPMRYVYIGVAASTAIWRSEIVRLTVKVIFDNYNVLSQGKVTTASAIPVKTKQKGF
jgi:hypothetical protein